jgi:soluble lytic murein transglycosylase-like protein
MIVLSRGLALATVALALVVVTHFSAKSVPDRPHPPRIETLASLSRLPEAWPERIAPSLDGMRPGATAAEVRETVRLVDRYARESGVDPLLVLAVIHVESRFDRYAVSPQGAVGLMQLLPATAQALAGEIGLEWTSDDLLFDPEVNVRLGTRYLRQLVERFDNLDAALAAFHAGPTRIEARLARRAGFSLGYADRVWNVLFRLQADVLA